LRAITGHAAALGRRDFAAARASYRRQRRAAQRLRATDPAEPQWPPAPGARAAPAPRPRPVRHARVSDAPSLNALAADLLPGRAVVSLSELSNAVRAAGLEDGPTRMRSVRGTG
jgi:hypothetical protein